jgi:uncharacterized membrane protein HdeD (DUF308 family)
MSSPSPFAGARSSGVAVWVWLAVGGAVSLVLGLVSLLAPGATLTVLAVVLSLWLVAAGLSRVALASAMRSWSSGRRLLQGALGVLLAAGGVAGLLGVWNSLTLVTVVVAVGFLVAAAADLATAFAAPRGPGRFATAALGLLHLGIGLTFLLLPDVGLTVLAVLVGILLVVLGGMQLLAALLVRALVRQADALAARLEGEGLGDGGDDGDVPRVIRGEVL